MNKSNSLILLLCASMIIINGYGQTKRKTVYDSSLVGDRITPAVSSILMPKTYTEVLLSNSMLTGNRYFTGSRSSISLDDRSTFLFNTLQITHGISTSGRFNIGLDISYRTGRIDADRKSSPLKVFGNDGEGLINYARGFAALGLRARYAVNKNKSFVIQHTLYVPFQRYTNDVSFLGDPRFALNTQFLYNKLLGRKVFLFAQADVFIQFETDQTTMNFSIPVNLYATYLLTPHLFPFAQLGVSNSFLNDFYLYSQSFTYGVGLQYQFNSMFTTNIFYNDFFAGKSSTAWNGFNFGVRVVL